jgi:hypothetical protein
MRRLSLIHVDHIGYQRTYDKSYRETNFIRSYNDKFFGVERARCCKTAFLFHSHELMTSWANMPNLINFH